MGVFQTKTSLIIKLFMKFFVSLDALSEKAPEIWKRYYTTGTLEVAVFNKEEKNGILAVKNFALHPLHCQLLEGYFGNMIKMVVGTPVVCEEKKCTFKGDDCHEFFVKW